MATCQGARAMRQGARQAGLLVMSALAIVVLVGCGEQGAVASHGSAPTGAAPAAPAATEVPRPTATVAPTATPAALTGDAIAAALRASGLPAIEVIIHTADSDPNKLLGRPGQYIAKVNWKDQRVAESLGTLVADATIEVYTDDAALKARVDYTEAISKASPLFLQYISTNPKRRATMRLPKDLTPDQAKQYETWLMAL